MIASLPMYWRSETAPAWQGFWQLVSENAEARLPELTPPEALPGDSYAHWRDPDLLLSMTCGYPYRTGLRDNVDYVGTLTFALDAPEGHYFSRVIRRKGARGGTEGLRLAVNSFDSQSGWACVRDPGPDNPKFVISEIIETGGHAASLAAVADAAADVAYIDAVTWELLVSHDLNASKVELWGRTSATPGLPLITARGREVEPLRRALKAACDGLDAAMSKSLVGLNGFVVLDRAAYFEMHNHAPTQMTLR